jgi:HJR/Mrr/RecB family endonuclease
LGSRGMRRSVSEIRAEIDEVSSQLREKKEELSPLLTFDKKYLFSPENMADGAIFCIVLFFFYASLAGITSWIVVSILLFFSMLFAPDAAFKMLGTWYCAIPGVLMVSRGALSSYLVARKAGLETFSRIKRLKDEIFDLEAREKLLVSALALATTRLKEDERRRLQTFPEYWQALAAEKLENALAKMLSDIGFRTSLTKKSGDGGIDVIARNNGETYYIQCKGWSKPVGAPVIREIAGVVAAAKSEGRTIAVVAAPNGFTKDAKAFAVQAGVELWDTEHFVSIAPTFTVSD